MSAMQILSVEARLAEASGTSIVLTGPSGIGKTHALRTLDPARTLIIDVDRGALPLRDTTFDMVRPNGWEEIADLFCLVGGANPGLPPNSAYSQAHFDKVRGLLDVSKYDVFVIDSLTQVGRESFRWAETHPESPPRGGGRDSRQTYGQHARQMIAGLQHAQRGSPNKIIIMTAVLEKLVDDRGQSEWRVQVEGDKTSRELPGIVDHVIALDWLTFGASKKPVRAFVTQSPNDWNYPAKSRSDRLDPIERPDLGALITKLFKPAHPAPAKEETK
jgi:AAA domain